VVNGTQLKLPGEGEAGVRNGPPGDLFIDIQVEPHPLFKRESNDVCIDLSLSFPQAALGCTVDVPTLTGTVPLIIPAGTQPNQVFTLTGRGFPDMKKKELGDQRVRVTVETPVNMTEQQRRLIEKLASMNGPRIDPKRVTILSKIKTLIGYVR
jgi:molecular chaperone DnaJ